MQNLVTYQAYDINGYTFYTEEKDKCDYQNSGVTSEFYTDDNVKERFYGRIEEKGPMQNLVTYQAYDINGYTFYTEEKDNKCDYQNSGVTSEFYTDDNVKERFYGRIEEIWELDYCGEKVPMFRVRWAKSVEREDRYFTTMVIPEAAKSKAAGANVAAKKTYQAYDINGYTFYTEEKDNKCDYQNSGVTSEFYTDDNVKERFYGRIEEIWELDYCGEKVPMFRVRWAKSVEREDRYFTTMVIPEAAKSKAAGANVAAKKPSQSGPMFFDYRPDKA